jgi:arabinofuranosyltransferase
VTSAVLAPPARRSAAAPPRRVLQLALFALPIAVLIVAAWNYRWLSDDGFINLRVVRELQAGHGPVFNAGERVEASTSPLWVATLFVADLVLPLRLEWIAVLLGIATTVAGLLLVLKAATDLAPRSPGSNAIVVPTGIWVLVAFAPTWKFASSGLENGLFVFWFGASLALLARWSRDRRSLPGLGPAVVIGLGPLIRPDLAILAASLLAAVVVAARPPWRAAFRFLAAAFAAPLVYQLFRMGYYDSLVPNSAIAKEASRAWWSQGWSYLRDSIGPYWLWIPLVAIAAGCYVPLIRGYLTERDLRRLAIVVASAAGGLVHACYVTRVGGDFMHSRLLLPGLTAIVAPVAVSRLDRTIASRATVLVLAVWSFVAIGFLRSSADAPVTFVGTPRNAITLHDYGWQAGGSGRAWYTGPGVYFGETRLGVSPRAGLPASVVASFGVGLASYSLGTDVYVLDMLGLGDAFTSHLALHRRGVIAHEKPLPVPWVAARVLPPGTHVDAADFPMPSFFLPRPLDNPRGTFTERVDTARAALDCGALRDFLGRIDGTLGPRAFLANVWHAAGDTRLRIPPEPADAMARFCGSL